MPGKWKLHLVRDSGSAPEPVSTLSGEEQAHLLELADVALQNKKLDETKPVASNRAREVHEQLKRELKDAVERFERSRNDVA
jgi:hypothetical protein